MDFPVCWGSYWKRMVGYSLVDCNLSYALESPWSLKNKHLCRSPILGWSISISGGRPRHLVLTKTSPRWFWCAARVEKHSSSLCWYKKNNKPQGPTLTFWTRSWLKVKGHNHHRVSHVVVAEQSGKLTQMEESVEVKLRQVFPSFPVSPPLTKKK